jgi:U2 small nuclear ribonucleoprotein B''
MATTTVAKTNSSNMAAEQRVQPNQSLYLQNLPEKLQKPDLKRSLYMLFSTFGPILDVTAVKSSKMRGQAHVLFRDIHAATQAMRACQGMDFYGREMVRRMDTSLRCRKLEY